MESPLIHCPHCGFDLDRVRGVLEQDTLAFCLKCQFPLQLVAGKYRLERELWRGGSSIVYLAHHIHLDRDAERVVKVIRPEIFKIQGMEHRFRREVQITSALSQRNDHIVRIYDDFGSIPTLGHFYVMEYLQGETLSQLLEELASLPPLPFCFYLMLQLCDTMQFAHDTGVVHRDLKPHNLMMVQRKNDPYFLKVFDFGIAKPLSSEELAVTHVTQGSLGTPAYMAPEQCLNQPTDVRTDIYAMGIMLYEMLVGHTPFLPPEGESAFSAAVGIIEGHLTREPPPLREHQPDRVSPELEQVVLRALAKKPEQRYQSVEEFRLALEHVVSTWSTEAQELLRRLASEKVKPAIDLARKTPDEQNIQDFSLLDEQQGNNNTWYLGLSSRVVVAGQEDLPPADPRQAATQEMATLDREPLPTAPAPSPKASVIVAPELQADSEDDSEDDSEAVVLTEVSLDDDVLPHTNDRQPMFAPSSKNTPTSDISLGSVDDLDIEKKTTEIDSTEIEKKTTEIDSTDLEKKTTEMTPPAWVKEGLGGSAADEASALAGDTAAVPALDFPDTMLSVKNSADLDEELSASPTVEQVARPLADRVHGPHNGLIRMFVVQKDEWESDPFLVKKLKDRVEQLTSFIQSADFARLYPHCHGKVVLEAQSFPPEIANRMMQMGVELRLLPRVQEPAPAATKEANPQPRPTPIPVSVPAATPAPASVSASVSVPTSAPTPVSVAARPVAPVPASAGITSHTIPQAKPSLVSGSYPSSNGAPTSAPVDAPVPGQSPTPVALWADDIPAEPRPSGTLYALVAVVALFVLSMIGVLYGLSSPSPAPTGPPKGVITATVSSQNLPRFNYATATLTPDRRTFVLIPVVDNRSGAREIYVLFAAKENRRLLVFAPQSQSQVLQTIKENKDPQADEGQQLIPVWSKDLNGSDPKPAPRTYTGSLEHLQQYPDGPLELVLPDGHRNINKILGYRRLGIQFPMDSMILKVGQKPQPPDNPYRSLILLVSLLMALLSGGAFLGLRSRLQQPF